MRTVRSICSTLLISRLVILRFTAVTVALVSLAGEAKASTPSQPPLGVTAAPAYSRFTASIVNGLTSTAYPAVGLMLDLVEGSQCTGTLIGCRTFLTAAHCVCPEDTNTARQCERAGMANPSNLLIFFQHGGYSRVDTITIDPAYDFARAGDAAVLALSEPVSGFAPARINTTGRPPAGTRATIVGFGLTGGSQDAGAGILRRGAVTTSRCAGVPDNNHVCWSFAPPTGPPGEDSNTCQGDSGGPLFADFGAGEVLAGITSGGEPADCLANPGAMSFDTDVFSVRSFIQRIGGNDLNNTACGSLPQVGSPGAEVVAAAGVLEPGSDEARYRIEVAPGTTLARVAMNGGLGSAFEPNDFDLYVKYGSEPTADDNDCRDENPTPLGFCEFTAPALGTWHILVKRAAGEGLFQLVTAKFAGTVNPCVGDCDGSGQITVDDLLTMVNIALGNAAASDCEAGDANQDGQITVDEILAAVSNALNGCGS